MRSRGVLVVGNLDCELEWSGAPPLPRHVAGKIAAAATLLRAVVPDGEHAVVWTPEPVDPARLPAVSASPHWRLLSSRGLPSVEGAVLPWGATARLRSEPRDVFMDDGSPWRNVLASLPPPSVAAARAASDRRLAHAIAARLGVGLPGARTITTVDELAGHLAAGGADASPTDTWVVKATLTAAGRDRVRRRGAILDGATIRRVERLLERGPLVFEPWMDRILDLGQPGLVLGPHSWRLLPMHQLHSDGAGGFAGISIHANGWIRPSLCGGVTDAAVAAARELAALGYRGPFTVDAFVHRDGAGAMHVHPIAEINPRLTFGLVARAWSERLGAPLTLRIAETAPPAGAITLVRPVAGEPTAAWLEAQGQTVAVRDSES